MTNLKGTSPVRPENRLHVRIAPEGRKLYFEKECLEEVKIFRKVNDGEWKVLIVNPAIPFVDNERFEPPVHIRYKASFEDSRKVSSVVDVHLPEET